MLTKQPKIKSILKTQFLLIALLCLCAGGGGLRAQEIAADQAKLPLMRDYKGVTIGMTADEVRGKLGEAKSEDKDGFFYVFSDNESAQILLDGEKKVNVISITYRDGFENPPDCKSIFGEGVEPDTRPSGSLYKMVRYPEAGYWIAYSRIPGDKPITSVTITKI